MTGEVPIGTHAPGALETISHTKVKDLRKKLRVTLPGAIDRVGQKYLASLIPSAVLLHRAGATATPDFRVLTVYETDPAPGDAVVIPFEKRHGRKIPVGFQVLIESDEITYGDVIGSGDKNPFTPASPGRVRQRIAYRFRRSTRWTTSDSWPALITTSHGIGVNNIFAVWETWSWFAFDCHAHQESMFPGFGRWTWCHDTGPCPPPTACLISPGKKIGQGWCLCTCQ